MKNHEVELVYWLSLAAAMLFLMAGAGLAGDWAYAILVLLFAAFDWLARHFSWKWGPGALLLAYLAVAVNALMLHFSPALLIAGVTAALVHWELSDSATGDAPFSRLYERQRLKALGRYAALGAVLAEAGLLLRLRLSFVSVLLAACLLLFCLYRLFSVPAARK
ncbi:hypothetical protein FDZ74_04670 [bacterium]|nr:MAG: hypothetical protein FDZ74_04670 [bacterium]